jgi:hypothetical protein
MTKKTKKSKDEIIDTTGEIVDGNAKEATELGVEQVDNPADFFKGLRMRTVLQLQEKGQGIRGIYRGQSDPVMITDGQEKRPVNTWAIETQSGMVLRLMGSACLDRELGSLEPPCTVAIIKGETKQSGKKQINIFHVAAGPKISE